MMITSGLPGSPTTAVRSATPRQPSTRDAGLAISAVVPVYNSQSTLGPLVERLSRALEDLAAGRFEILLVNDGSRDASWSVIQRLVEERSWVVGLDLMRNYGQHNALLAGIRAAKGEIIVTLDDDLQNPPEQIFRLLAVLEEENCDVVYGTPQREEHGLWRNLASRVTKMALQSAMGIEAARNVSAFRVFRGAMREAFADFGGPHVSIDVLLTWAGSKFRAVRVEHEPRRHGYTNYTLRKLITHAFNMVTGFSTLPLKLASLVGFAFTLFGIGVLAYVLGRYFFEGASVQGFPFLASIIAIFSGAQLFALGIMGEYLARMHFRMMDRPAYAIKSRVSGAIVTLDSRR